MEEKRKSPRKKIAVTTLLRREKPEGGHAVMEFRSSDLSFGGVFISTEDLSILDLGEEIEILVDANREKYYEGRARVVRSARVFSEEGGQVDSGFGLMFLNPNESFQAMLKEKLRD
jgi:hypothetical protein